MPKQSASELDEHPAIYPVDWESAAVAAGEIDLAALTEGWPPGFVEQCELEYQRARWPEGPPTGFERRLAAAPVPAFSLAGQRDGPRSVAVAVRTIAL
jgi:hypothetical protein